MEYQEVTSRQKDEIGEAIVTSPRNGIVDLLDAWVVEDLRKHENLEIPSKDVLSIRKRSLDEFEQHLNSDDLEGIWIPDALFHVTIYPELIDDSTFPITYQYPLEIVTNQSLSIDENQRRVMESLGASEDQIIPVCAEMDLQELPEQYGISLIRIQERH